MNRYYYEVVGPFWPPERKLVENFADLPFPFHEIEPRKFEMTTQCNLDHLIGCLRTWSSTQQFIAAKGSDPLQEINDDLRNAWGDPQQKRKVMWPLIVRVGVNQGAAAGAVAAAEAASAPTRKASPIVKRLNRRAQWRSNRLL